MEANYKNNYYYIQEYKCINFTYDIKKKEVNLFQSMKEPAGKKYNTRNMKRWKLKNWFTQVRSSNIPISAPIL
jgi:hypothetical protein